MRNTERETIGGTVESIVFRNEDNGFTVLEIEYEEELLTVVGAFADISVGESITATGIFAAHPTYGRQFKADFIERELPSGAAGIFKYLAGGVVKGIGPATAKRIVDVFGDKTIEVLESTPEMLSRVKGISEKKALEIGAEFKRLFGIRSVMLFLSRYGIESNSAIKVWKNWGMTAPSVIKDNPYILCTEDIGLDFNKADNIAKTLELPEDSKCRIEGAVKYVLRANIMAGHCCLPREKLLDKASLILKVEINEIDTVVDELIDNEYLFSVTEKARQYIYLPYIYEAETYVAGRIKMMLMLSFNEEKDRSNKIDEIEQEIGIKYADLQRDAIAGAVNNGIFILTGGPGTGKTTTLNGIIKLLDKEGYKVALSAPTGRAAKRMAEVTGREAKTIHRLLEVDFKDDKGLNKFKRNLQNPLPYDAVIIDEMSMVDICLFEHLIKALRMGSKLIMVGDIDQLPPVGPGNVLKDFIDSEKIARVHLSEIFRQAAESLIVTNAHKIVGGEYPDLTIKDKDFFFLPQPSQNACVSVITSLIAKRLPKTYGYSPLWDIQVMCPSRIGTLGTNEINHALQKELNPPSPTKTEHKTPFTLFREGDKVMQVKNNYDIVWEKDSGEGGTGVFNGDIGIIDLIDRPSKSILVKFDDRTAQYHFDMADELELAYAITIHKSQGNEFEAIIMPLMGSHGKLHYRNLLYTAVTRGKKLVIIAGQASTVTQMVDNNRKSKRYSNLKELIKGD